MRPAAILTLDPFQDLMARRPTWKLNIEEVSVTENDHVVMTLALEMISTFASCCGSLTSDSVDLRCIFISNRRLSARLRPNAFDQVIHHNICLAMTYSTVYKHCQGTGRETTVYTEYVVIAPQDLKAISILQTLPQIL